MRNFSKLAVGVAMALAGSSAFAAIDFNTAFGVKLTVAGSSAFEGTFLSEMGPTLCSDTPVQFLSGSGVHLRAYGCTLKTSITTSDGTVWSFPANTTALIYYRAEGGSVYGVGPVAKNITEQRLKVDSGCSGAASPFTCSVTALNLTTDVATGAQAESKAVQLGVSDLEPAMFTGENWPTGGFLGNAPTTTELGNISSITPTIGQVFAVYVNSGIPGASGGSINLTKEAVSGIFAGSLTNWNKVPKADGTGYVSSTSLPVKICLRDIGSGTQTGASLFFNGMTCSSAAKKFATTGGLARNASTGAETGCIGTNAGAIGYAAIQQALPSSTALVSIDGVAPDPIAAAKGQYDYWYEATFNSGAALNTDEGPLANQNAVNGVSSNAAALAAIMIDDLVKSTTAPVIGTAAGQTESVISLGNAQNPIVVPVSTTNPVATGTHFGNSCFQPTGSK